MLQVGKNLSMIKKTVKGNNKHKYINVQMCGFYLHLYTDNVQYCLKVKLFFIPDVWLVNSLSGAMPVSHEDVRRPLMCCRASFSGQHAKELLTSRQIVSGSPTISPVQNETGS